MVICLLFLQSCRLIIIDVINARKKKEKVKISTNFAFISSPVNISIRNFTYEGWGVTIRYDFSRDQGEVVTLARFDPTATKLLVTKGEIVGGHGFDQISCSEGPIIKIPRAMDFFRKESDFGHHLAMVYGDYTQDIEELAQIMHFDVVSVI